MSEILVWRDALLHHRIVPAHGSEEERFLLEVLQPPGQHFPLPYTLEDIERRLIACMLVAPDWDDKRVSKHTGIPMAEVRKVRKAVAADHPAVVRRRAEMAAIDRQLQEAAQTGRHSSSSNAIETTLNGGNCVGRRPGRPGQQELFDDAKGGN